MAKTLEVARCGRFLVVLALARLLDILVAGEVPAGRTWSQIGAQGQVRLRLCSVPWEVPRAGRSPCPPSQHIPGLSPRAAGTAPHTLGPHTHVLPVLFIPVAGNDGEPNATLGSVWEGTQGCFLGAALGFGAAPPLLEAALG